MQSARSAARSKCGSAAGSWARLPLHPLPGRPGRV